MMKKTCLALLSLCLLTAVLGACASPSPVPIPPPAGEPGELLPSSEMDYQITTPEPDDRHNRVTAEPGNQDRLVTDNPDNDLENQ